MLRGAFLLSLALTWLPTLADSARSEPLDRPPEPVVLLAAKAEPLLGRDPGALVAFRWNGGWEAVPVQVDERDRRAYTDVYDGARELPWIAPESLDEVYGVFYVDPGTFMGPDRDPTLDEDDEIVFMARDTGEPAPLGDEPDGVVPGSGVEVQVRDPLDGGIGHIYLFTSQGELSPGAGTRYVNYRFRLVSGEYRETYDLGSGPNLERSIVSTPAYGRVFSDRWVDESLTIKAGDASNVDILDRHRNLFDPSDCSRNEESFSRQEGAFLVNKSGPVRALRSYLGANEGATSQRIHRFYAEREEIESQLRFPAIPGYMSLFDYSKEAEGMTYFNNNAVAGVVIDTLKDEVAQGPLHWELVTGKQGSLAILHSIETSIPGLELSGHYEDDFSPQHRQCTGDPIARGASGPVIASELPDTDPRSSEETLTLRRTLYYGAPDLDPADVEQFMGWRDEPLEVTASLWGESALVERLLWPLLGGLFVLVFVLGRKRLR